MIGAIVLTYRKREGVKRQSYFTQISREREDSVKLVEVESGKGVNLDD
jgi:NADH-quinone oxidoreductase subunit J